VPSRFGSRRRPVDAGLLHDDLVEAVSLYITPQREMSKVEPYQKPLMLLIRLELSQSSEVAFFQRDAFDRVRLLTSVSLFLCC